MSPELMWQLSKPAWPLGQILSSQSFLNEGLFLQLTIILVV